MMWLEVTHAPWTLRLEVRSQFPDALYLVGWLREQVAGANPPGISELGRRVAEKWPDRKYRIAQAQKIGRIVVEG